MEEQLAIQGAASAGLKSMEHLIHLLSTTACNSSSFSSNNNNNFDCSEITDFTVFMFKQVINILNRTEHARFHSAPPQPKPQAPPQPHPTSQPQPQTKGFTLDFIKPTIVNSKPCNKDKNVTLSTTTTTSSSFLSSVTNGVNVSDGKIGHFLPSSIPKPPHSSSHRKKCHEVALSAKPSCHCSKKRSSPVFFKKNNN